MELNPSKLLFHAGLFAVGMGFLESAVVIYLRALYYPAGFDFPLIAMKGNIILTEILREAATMLMLVYLAIIAVRPFLLRFAVFVYTFAVWDIFYYLFLYLILGWPPSVFTWDLLFLIPSIWTGPVLAPVINSLTMIILASGILFSYAKNHSFRLTAFEWSLLLLGSFITIIAYTQDYLSYMLNKFPIRELVTFTPSTEVTEYATNYVPVNFNWMVFFLAEALFLISIVKFFFRTGLIPVKPKLQKQ